MFVFFILKEKELYYNNSYVDYFGEEINSVFGDNYIVKIRFGHFYKEVINGQYHIALKSLRESKCLSFSIISPFSLINEYFLRHG